MSEKEKAKPLLKTMPHRIAKAVIKGALYFVFLYVLPMFLISQVSALAPELFATYGQLVSLFAATTVFFVVASELTAGTIYQHAFNIGKTIIFLIFFFLALEGGIITFDFQTIHIWADLRIYLLMLLSINLLGLAKSVLAAINFLSEKTTNDKLIDQKI